MDLRESAASKALAIPEILSAVLLLLQHEEDQPLISCTLVNSRWERVANALVWERCGSHSSKNGIPSIRALASLPPARRQAYANMVRVLMIQVEDDLLYTVAEDQSQDQWGNDQRIEQHQDEDLPERNTPDDNQESNDQQEANIQDAYREDTEPQEGSPQDDISEQTYDSNEFTFSLPPGSWAGIHLAQLHGISFPQLEELHIHGPAVEEDRCGFQPDLLMQFFQPKLKKLFMIKGDIHCDMISLELLEHLEHSCKDLKQVLIEREVVGVSLQRFRSFLMSVPSLESTFSGWSEFMSTDLFHAVSRLPHLKCLSLDIVEDEWIDSVPFHKEPSGSTFASLTKFFCSISAHGLRGMLPYLGNIRHLSLIEIDATPCLWKELSLGQFKSLESIQLYLHEDTVIDSNEFLAVLQLASKLHNLMLSGPRNDYYKSVSISMEPFDDSVMEAIAQRVPMLEVLDLCCTSATTGSLGENTLLALGINCPLLQSVSIAGTVDWARFVEISPLGLWAHLKTLHVREHRGNWDGRIEDKHRELARQIRLIMPFLNPQQKGISMGKDIALEHAVLQEFADGQD